MYTHLVTTPAAERFQDTQSRRDALRLQADQTVNALTIDVEDYFQVSAFAPFIERSAWDSIPCRAEANVQRILALLAEHDAKATFFTLGWIAERHPEIVRAIVAQGHEIASHGYGHQRASDLTPAEFTEDIVSAKALLEDIGGVAVLGYRAPSFSIGHKNLWALDCIRDAGYRYSSSIYPVKHDHYGMPDAPRFAYTAVPGLMEVPPTTVELFSRNWPAGGGGFFRLLPYAMSRWLLQRVNRVRRRVVHVLFPSMGDGSFAAAGRGHRCEDALSPLRQPEPHGRPPRPAAAGLPLGPRRSRLPARGAVTQHP